MNREEMEAGVAKGDEDLEGMERGLVLFVVTHVKGSEWTLYVPLCVHCSSVKLVNKKSMSDKFYISSYKNMTSQLR